MPLYLGNTPIGGVKTSILGDSVLYTEQNLTEEQKAQARENIGAIGEDEVDTSISVVTADKDGLMLATDKVKLDNIAQGAEVNVQVDLFENDTNSDAYVKNRIFGYYSSEEQVTIFPQTTISLPAHDGDMRWQRYDLSFNMDDIGKEYIVLLDNVQYRCTLIGEGSVPMLGNLSDEYPFSLWYDYLEGAYCVVFADESVQHTLQIDLIDRIPVKLTSYWIESAKPIPHAQSSHHYPDGDDPITPGMIRAADKLHAAQHGTDGLDPITPASIGAATTAIVTGEANGLMIAADKTKLDGVAEGATRVTSPADIGAASTANSEAWVFTLDDGSTVTKEVILK